MRHSQEELLGALAQVRSVLICTHVFPDVDAVGSSCGLLLGLKKLGVEASVWFPKPLPEKFRRLTAAVAISYEAPLRRFDALLGVDTATRARLGAGCLEAGSRADRVFNIDHHISNEDWAELNYVDVEASASAEIVEALLGRLGVELDSRIAELLYAGILDDTGCFRYSNATPRALAAASRLVRHGVRAEQTANDLYFSVPERVFRLRARALASLCLEFDGRVAVITVTKAMLIECGAVDSDCEGLIDLAREVQGTLCAIFIRETDEGWKASLRSKDDQLDVHAVAAAFGGGGHRAAAGCTIRDSLETVRSLVLARLEDSLKAIK